MPKRYYALEQSGTAADLYIFGDITSYRWFEKDKDAYSIVKELEGLDADTVNVHINSCGGNVSEGLAIYNILKNKGAKITTYCDGFACSIASVVFMAGDERIMNTASLLMVHNPWMVMRGNAKDFRKQADDLDKITQAAINAYMTRVNITEEKLKDLLDHESWITAEEAMEYGFATKVLDPDEDGVKQSAMMSIRERILNRSGIPQAFSMNDEIGKKIAEMVIEGISPVLETTKEVKEEEQKNSAGWGAFFNTGKGE